jgi:hypothetical protein
MDTPTGGAQGLQVPYARAVPRNRRPITSFQRDTLEFQTRGPPKTSCSVQKRGVAAIFADLSSSIENLVTFAKMGGL